MKRLIGLFCRILGHDWLTTWAIRQGQRITGGCHRECRRCGVTEGYWLRRV